MRLAAGTTCIRTAEVVARREPGVLVGHDADGGIGQLIDTTGADGRTGKIEHLHHAVDENPTLIDVLDPPPGSSATATTAQARGRVTSAARRTEHPGPPRPRQA